MILHANTGTPTMRSSKYTAPQQQSVDTGRVNTKISTPWSKLVAPRSPEPPDFKNMQRSPSMISNWLFRLQQLITRWLYRDHKRRYKNLEPSDD